MITQEEKIYAMEKIISMVEDDYNRKEIQKQKTITQATKKAKELCNWSGFIDSKMCVLGFPQGIEVSTEDSQGEIAWEEVAEYAKRGAKEQVSLF